MTPEPAQATAPPRPGLVASTAREPGVAMALRLLLPLALGLLSLFAVFDVRYVVVGYTSWHALLETLSVAISLLVGVTAAFGIDRDRGLRAIALGFIAVALLDLQHMLSFKGMPDWLGEASAERSIVYWLGARTAVLWPFLALLLAPRWHRPLVALMLVHLLAWSLYGQLLPAVLPRWFEHGTGLTGAKIGFEFALVGAYLLLAWLLQRRPSRLRADLLAAGLLVLAAGELFFTLYRDAAGLANLLGHVFKLLGQAFFLRAVLLAHIIDPLLALRLETQQRQAWAQRLLDLFRGAPEGIMVVNPQGIVLACNPPAERMFGYAPEQLRGCAIEDLVPAGVRMRHAELRAGFHARPAVRLMAAVRELKACRRDGSEFYVDVSLSPVEWQGESCALAFVRDASERVAQLHRLDWLAAHDELTALPNRRGLLQEIDRRLAAGEQGACVLLGLDHLGRINDALGRDRGDDVLRTVAADIRSLLRPGEFVGRQEGDKFLWLLPAWTGDEADLDARLRGLHRQLELADGVRIELSFTAGFCRYPEDARTGAVLQQCAEIALAVAKRSARQRAFGFRRELHVQGRRWFEIASRLPAALESAEFHLVYQPRVDARTRAIAGHEALLRWRHEGQPVSPAEFIPIAEQTGFILVLGRWVLDQAIAQAAVWQRHGSGCGRIAVNLSTRQLADSALPDFLRECLHRHGLQASQIELEITETAAMENLDWALPRLQALAAIGVELALDDFGTGYSSLAYLQSLPCAVLKIDISFVRRIGSDEGEALLRTILGLAHSLGKRCVAEGVEHERQLDWLRRHGCDEVQGYLISPPVPASQVLQAPLRGVDVGSASGAGPSDRAEMAPA